jgi:hypothetical protein
VINLDRHFLQDQQRQGSTAQREYLDACPDIACNELEPARQLPTRKVIHLLNETDLDGNVTQLERTDTDVTRERVWGIRRTYDLGNGVDPGQATD